MENAALPAALRIQQMNNSGDLAGLDQCVTADFIDHSAPADVPPGSHGYAETLAFVTGVLHIHYELNDLIQTPDRIVIRATASGVGVPAIHGPQADGKSYEMTTVHIFRTQGELLAEHWGVRDELAVMRQLSGLPAGGGPAH